MHLGPWPGSQRRHRPGDGLAMPGDGEFLAPGDSLPKLGPAGPGLERIDGLHAASRYRGATMINRTAGAAPRGGAARSARGGASRTVGAPFGGAEAGTAAAGAAPPRPHHSVLS